MAPDLNSLPPSRSMSSSPSQPRVSASPATTTLHRRDTPSPRSSSISLAAAATMNAADLSRRSSISNTRGSPRASRATERRRSNTAMTLNLSDPTMPSPGELSSSDHRASVGHSFMAASPTTLNGMRTLSNGDPHHHQRAPSLGELHQVLEQEQEAQVNRMLEMIRQQQLQLDTLRNTQPDGHPSRHSSHSTAITPGITSTAIDDSTPTSERSAFMPSSEHTANLPRTGSLRRRPSHPIPSPSQSQSQSPHLSHHPSESGGGSSSEWPPSPVEQLRRNSLRDESAYFQAETASLTRENQMLRSRIRELERQVGVMNATQANTPVTPSGLVREESVEKV